VCVCVCVCVFMASTAPCSSSGWALLMADPALAVCQWEPSIYEICVCCRAAVASRISSGTVVVSGLTTQQSSNHRSEGVTISTLDDSSPEPALDGPKHKES
jgi:hypothetical protein